MDMIAHIELTHKLLKATVDLHNGSADWNPRKNAHLATAQAALHLLHGWPDSSGKAVDGLIDKARSELIPGSPEDPGTVALPKAPDLNLRQALIYLEAALYRLTASRAAAIRRRVADMVEDEETV